MLNKGTNIYCPAWIFFLCGVLFLHFVVVRLPFFGGSLFYFFGLPLFLIVFIRFLKNPNRFFPKGSMGLLLIFLGYQLLVAIIVHFVYDSEGSLWLRQAYKSVLLYIAIVGLTSDFRDTHIIVKFSTIVVVVASLIGLLIFLFGPPFSTISKLLTYGLSTALGKISLSTFGSHTSGLSANRHYYPYHLCYALFPVIYFLVQSKGLKRTAWFLMILVLLLSGLATGQRALLVSWFLGGMYLVFRHGRYYLSPRRIVTIFLIIFTVLAVSSTMFKTDTIRRHLSMTESGGHTSRFGLLLVGIYCFMDNPMGYGLGGKEFSEKYKIYFSRFVKKDHVTSLHNSFLDPFVRGGIIAMLLVVAFFLCVVGIIRKRPRTPRETLFLRDSLVASLIAVLSISLFHNNGFFVGEGTSFLCLALLCSRGFKRSYYSWNSDSIRDKKMCFSLERQ